jgi:hypothetical protein
VTALLCEVKAMVLNMAVGWGVSQVSRSSVVRLPLPCTRVTSCLTLVLLICLETVLLSTVSCTKTFTVHWNTTNPM